MQGLQPDLTKINYTSSRKWLSLPRSPWILLSVKTLGWAACDVKCSDRLMGQFVAHHFHVRGHVQVQVWRQVTLGTPSREATPRPWRVRQEIRGVTSLLLLEGISILNRNITMAPTKFLEKLWLSPEKNEIFPCRRCIWAVSGGWGQYWGSFQGGF